MLTVAFFLPSFLLPFSSPSHSSGRTPGYLVAGKGYRVVGKERAGGIWHDGVESQLECDWQCAGRVAG